MIISHRHQFVYFRVPKTGSSTSELMLRLSGAFNDDDIMGPICGLKATNIPQRVIDRMRERVGVNLRKIYGAAGPIDEVYLAQQVENSLMTYVSHMGIKDTIKHGLLTLDQLRTYKVCAFVRDPFDRVLSAYFHMSGAVMVPALFKDAVRTDIRLRDTENILVRHLSDYFTYNGELLSKPFFFDDFNNEIRRMIKLVGGYHFAEIPRINPTRNRFAGDRSAFYDQETKDLLEKLLADDLTLYRSLQSNKQS